VKEKAKRDPSLALRMTEKIDSKRKCRSLDHARDGKCKAKHQNLKRREIRRREEQLLLRPNRARLRSLGMTT
jgi:hypothetical protein